MQTKCTPNPPPNQSTPLPCCIVPIGCRQSQEGVLTIVKSHLVSNEVLVARALAVGQKGQAPGSAAPGYGSQGPGQWQAQGLHAYLSTQRLDTNWFWSHGSGLGPEDLGSRAVQVCVYV